MAPRPDLVWPVPNPEILTFKLPPRPGIKRRLCARCGLIHHTRQEVLACASGDSLGAETRQGD